MNTITSRATFDQQEFDKWLAYLIRFKRPVPTEEQAAALRRVALLMSRAEQMRNKKPTDAEEIRQHTEEINALRGELQVAATSVIHAYMTVSTERVN